MDVSPASSDLQIIDDGEHQHNQQVYPSYTLDTTRTTSQAE